MIGRLTIGTLLLVGGVGCGCIVALAPDIAGAVIVLLLPSVLLWLFDPTPGRAIGRTILLFQMAGSVRPIVSIWFQCQGLRNCVVMATRTRTVLILILFAAFGLMLTLALPMLIKLIDDRRTKSRLQDLTAERQRLSEEWELNS